MDGNLAMSNIMEVNEDNPLYQDTMKTDNELIAEFMGWIILGEPEFKHPYTMWVGPTGALMWARTDLEGNKYEEKFRYDTSWDWLMPVVEKISKLYYVEGLKDYPVYHVEFAHSLLNLRIDTPIDQVYAEVVRSIKWCNSNK